MRSQCRLWIVSFEGNIWIWRVLADIRRLLLIINRTTCWWYNLRHGGAAVVHYDLAGVVVQDLVLLFLFDLVILPLFCCLVRFARNLWEIDLITVVLLHQLSDLSNLFIDMVVAYKLPLLLLIELFVPGISRVQALARRVHGEWWIFGAGILWSQWLLQLPGFLFWFVDLKYLLKFFTNNGVCSILDHWIGAYLAGAFVFVSAPAVRPLKQLLVLDVDWLR